MPVSEPPPWPPNADLTWIGRPVPRLNGRSKVTGATRYTVDVRLPGMLYARLLRSPLPCAELRRLDTTEAAARPEVRAILPLAKPGDRLRYAGQPVAAVAALSLSDAAEALAAMDVEFRPLPFVVDMDEARAPGAPAVHDAASAPAGHPSGFPAAPGLPLEGNVRGPAVVRRGDPAAGLAGADVVVEGEYRTQVHTHACLEPHAIVADWRADGLTVYISTQFTAGVRQELATAFGLPLSRVRVVVDGMGGGFGAKSQLGLYGRAAVQLSRAVGAPVYLAFDRTEEQVDAGNRPGTVQRLRLGAMRDGTLSALAIESFGTAGVTVGAGIGFFAERLYSCANFETRQHDVFVNAGPGCAMRGPGNTPGAFAVEQAVDALAERLGIDPLVLRDRIDPSPVRREERRIGAERIGWSGRHRPGAETGPVKRGIGMAQSLWMSNVQTNVACEVRILRDGSVEALSSVQDIGTGVGTVMAQVVAEVLGLRPQDITIRIGDTEFPPGGPSYGSRTTASITPPLRTAATRVLAQLAREAGRMLNAAPDEIEASAGRLQVRTDPTRFLAFRDAAALLRTDRVSAVESRLDDYGGFRRRMPDAAMALEDLGGVQFAAVAVDTETGVIRVERVVAVHDCGRPMNQLLLESQVQGGVLMGISYALLERRIMDRRTGLMVNADLEHYKLAGIHDTPEIETVILENLQGNSATDAYGIAEPANIATAPAIANAVYNAIGVRLTSLPMTPDTVLAALARTGRS
ncbi:MAG: xanthine dehydrogenase family protein molybdopterin-binding subunit [Rhodospirillales bacterium]|nr:xanthine dehydrogenase family protein molybdopterin-binding subunit [Rhodospirillales bacterium]